MSDITRWKVSGPATRLQPDADGPWVALVDYYRVIDRLIAERDAAQAEVERLTQERDEARAERDAAQRERERVQGLLWLRGRELPTLQRDQPAQNVNMVSGQAILDSSRPDDETIWREAFMAAVHDVHKNWMDVADVALAQYRKRWPR